MDIDTLHFVTSEGMKAQNFILNWQDIERQQESSFSLLISIINEIHYGMVEFALC